MTQERKTPKEPRQILVRLICRENGMPYETKLDNVEDENVDLALQELSEWVRGQKMLIPIKNAALMSDYDLGFNQACEELARGMK